MLKLKRAVRADKQTPEKVFSFGGRRLRHELKYVINEGTYLALRSRLLPLMAPDAHSGGNYRVTGLYFDDVFSGAYTDKVNGVMTRRKFRVRCYNLDESYITLEVKHKDGEYVSKLSAPLTKERYKALLGGDCSFMRDDEDEENAFGEYYRSDRLTHLQPRVIVDYWREALVYPFGNVRITFDRQLSTCYNTLDMFDPDAFYSPISTKDIILEVKFDSYIPESIAALLQGLETPRQSVSKYVLCCDRITEVKAHG